MAHSGYDVVLVRHGETVGYDDDLGLTERGEQQASDRGKALAAELSPGTRVVMPHARSRRATATAVVLHRELSEAADLDLGALYPEPYFDNLRASMDGVVEDMNVSMARRLALPAAASPDWAREFDRFDTDYRGVAAAGGPIEFWVRTPTLFLEPPALSVHRMWAGITALAPESGSLSAVVATHSAPMRAMLNTALGHDPGEPENLEEIRVRVAPDDSAEVTYRGETVGYSGPPVLPPWFDRTFLDTFGR
ncbi:MAG: phosphoglycerate mutase family protein [Actinomycetota bacterium]|nr:phosphoglycerate mutase family protein [Actinomycetota bacterium]